MFDLGGAYFGLFYATYDGEKLVFGNNCVPNIEVEDIEAEYERVGALAAEIDPGIHRVGDYRYFQFKDTEGNIVELYAVCRERAA
jgi:predicted enzyme related to lactoylglutathione lyase